MKLADKLQEMFGADYIVKSKQVEKLISNDKIEVVSCSFNEVLGRHLIRTNKKTKRLGVETTITLHAVPTDSGAWWIQG
ncbi:hypothetical protein [Priestia megaterium]|uniref:hypothetical protein n=1 Tax=Priestia megaterium TaxID=1404 RepID=UPI000BFDD9FC|nr:hypothetical protein [Priestia megaterium]PGO60660.1 hypothetical protein CN981_08915 [Priestia megaterium]